MTGFPSLKAECRLRSVSASKRGIAMVPTIAILTLMAILVLAYASVAVESARWTQQQSDEQRLDNAAESALALAVNGIWMPFSQSRAGLRTRPIDFRLHMDRLGILDQSAALTKTYSDLRGQLSLPTDIRGNDGLSNISVGEITVLREDTPTRSLLTFEASVSTRPLNGTNDRGKISKTVQQVWGVERGEWDGLDYALLANNINCIMCHASIDNARRLYNTDPALYNTFERVKVGSLESVEMRDSVSSFIAGTLYLGGRGYDSAGRTITNWPDRDLHSRAFDANGMLQEDAFGNTVSSRMQPADTTSPAAGENLYLNYGAGGALPDGFIPDSFPAVFADDGGIDAGTGLPVPGNADNRVLDDSEFYATVVDSTGTLGGGSIHVSAPGQVVDTAAELSALTTGNTSSLNSITEGNVYLVGTDANPILLNGEVAVKGDVFISGVVKGSGTLRVSGNVYIPSDLQYADGSDSNGNRTFGVDSNGDTNALAIASGGNVLVGNIFHPRWGNGTTTGEPDGSFSFIMDELAIFNRQEWTKTQALLPGPTDDTADPTTYSVTNPLYEGVDYIPRYYSFGEGGTVPIFNQGIYFDDASSSWVGRELPGSWGDRYLTEANPNDPSDRTLYAADGSPRAVLSSLTASNGWMSEAMLRNQLESILAGRDASQDLRVDATLYSNNSIFGIIPTSRRGPGLNGRTVINGGIVAADVGLLSPSSIEINFDDRGRGLLDITSDNTLTIRRQLYAPARP